MRGLICKAPPPRPTRGRSVARKRKEETNTRNTNGKRAQNQEESHQPENFPFALQRTRARSSSSYSQLRGFDRILLGGVRCRGLGSRSMAEGFGRWESDPLFPAAECVQDSADRYGDFSIFPLLLIFLYVLLAGILRVARSNLPGFAATLWGIWCGLGMRGASSGARDSLCMILCAPVPLSGLVFACNKLGPIFW
jgi:hypothetical protein